MTTQVRCTRVQAGGVAAWECLADIESRLPLVRPGGLIAGHDYWSRFPGVMDAVNEAFGGDFAVAPETRIWWHRKPA